MKRLLLLLSVALISLSLTNCYKETIYLKEKVNSTITYTLSSDKSVKSFLGKDSGSSIIILNQNKFIRIYDWSTIKSPFIIIDVVDSSFVKLSIVRDRFDTIVSYKGMIYGKTDFRY